MSDQNPIVVLPERKQMFEVLLKVSDDKYLVESFYPRLLEHAGEEKYPQGVVLMVQLAKYYFIKSLPEPFNSLMLLLIETKKVVAALIGDNEEALAIAEIHYDEAASRANEDRPPQARVEDIPSEERLPLFKAAQQIAEVVLKFAETHNLGLSDNRDEEVNPFYGQTSNGLIIEMYYGRPSCLLTPWGKWSCWRSGSGEGNWDEMMPELLVLFDGFVYEAEKVTDMGHIGPFYGIHRVDDTNLPWPSKRNNVLFIEYEKAKAAWKELTTAV